MKRQFDLSPLFGFITIKLARELDSLVRVTRRVEGGGAEGGRGAGVCHAHYGPSRGGWEVQRSLKGPFDPHLPLPPRSLPCRQFQVLFYPFFKVLFIFRSRYFFAIGVVEIFSLGWCLPPDLDCIPKQSDSSS